jgi:hypothetical protein
MRLFVEVRTGSNPLSEGWAATRKTRLAKASTRQDNLSGLTLRLSNSFVNGRKPLSLDSSVEATFATLR